MAATAATDPAGQRNALMDVSSPPRIRDAASKPPIPASPPQAANSHGREILPHDEDPGITV
jgi:hypothetical protein